MARSPLQVPLLAALAAALGALLQGCGPSEEKVFDCGEGCTVTRTCFQDAVKQEIGTGCPKKQRGREQLKSGEGTCKSFDVWTNDRARKDACRTAGVKVDIEAGKKVDTKVDKKVVGQVDGKGCKKTDEKGGQDREDKIEEDDEQGKEVPASSLVSVQKHHQKGHHKNFRNGRD